MKDKDEITKKRLEIDAIRRVEKEADLDPFTRGQLAGAQQALYWMLEVGMDPIRAILSDSQMASIEAAEQDVAPDGAIEDSIEDSRYAEVCARIEELRYKPPRR